MQNTSGAAVKRIFVKVFGFSPAERSLLNTGFRLSESRDVTYALWMPEGRQPAEVILVDGNNWEASLDLANPEHDSAKLIWVGNNPPSKAWRSFAAPMQWRQILDVLDLFYAQQLLAERLGDSVDFDLDGSQKTSASHTLHAATESNEAADIDLAADFANAATRPAPLMDFGSADPDFDIYPSGAAASHAHDETEPAPLEGFSALPAADKWAAPDDRQARVMVVESDIYIRMYWRAKLGASGLFLVDEATTAEAALHMARFGRYRLVVLDLDVVGADSWTLVKQLRAFGPAIEHVWVTGEKLGWLQAFKAWRAGAGASFKKPLPPTRLKLLLEKIQNPV